MKVSPKADTLKYLVLGAGGLGLVLRYLLYATGIDGRGLLVEGHWAGIALIVLTVAVLAAIFIFTRSIEGVACPTRVFSAMGAFAALFGIAFTTGREFADFSSRLHLIVWLLGICATVAMGCIGISRLTGKQPHFLLSAALCLYFALRMVSKYQMWSADPQLQDYCFYLGAYMALMLTAYHHAAFCEGMGRHRALWFFSLAAVYLCAVSLQSGMDTLLMLGCGAWAFTNLPCFSLAEE